MEFQAINRKESYLGIKIQGLWRTNDRLGVGIGKFHREETGKSQAEEDLEYRLSLNFNL